MDLADLLLLLAVVLLVSAAAFVSTPLAFLVAGLSCGAGSLLLDSGPA